MSPVEEKYNIICFSNQLWDYPLWTNKRHVMSRLAQRGNTVLFVDPPINPGRVFLRHFLKKEWGFIRLLTGVKKVLNLFVYSPLNLAFPPSRSYKDHIKIINNLINKHLSKNQKTILWIYNVEIPFLDEYLKNIKHDFLIYDCVDNYSAFPKYDTPEKKKALIEQEQLLATRANVVFATAPGLVERLKRVNQNTFFTPNVGDYERFKEVLKLKDQVPADIKAIKEPRIGFTGAIDEYKFDRKLFRKLAQDFPTYSFVIIGPIALKDRDGSLKELGLDDLPNVYLFSTKPFEELPKYLAGFEAMIIPYQVNDYTVGGCFPVKFHEELAAGFPVVVTDLPAYTPFSEVCYISKSYAEFSQNVRKALEENSPEKVSARQKVAKENTWEGKVDSLLQIISEHI